MSRSEPDLGAFLAEFLVEVRGRVDAELARVLPEARGDDPGRLREAMRYAVLGGGKRLRPAVVAGAALAVGGSIERALPAMLAVELLHAYTLVHDDLPAMDDDVVRRGRPTVHVEFGEATAILVGDALLTQAFGELAALGGRAADAVRVLARRTGATGLIAGQARDLVDEPTPTIEALDRIHRAKTGDLFAASAELGAISGGADEAARGALGDYGLCLGIAFQYADDLADGDHPSLAEAARARLRHWLDAASARAEPFGERATPLRALIEWVAAAR